MEITLESITKKLGFNPLNPPQPEFSHENELDVDDVTPGLWDALTHEELVFLWPYIIGAPFPD